MIKAAHIDPRSNVVASLASQGSAIRTALRHAIVKFAMMRVDMAGRASHILKTERENLIGPACRPHFVAFGTSHSGMRSVQREPRLAMLCKDRKSVV